MSSILAKKKLLMAQGGGIDISEVFNTSLWTGTGAARTITTGIDSGEGALVWIKDRSFDYQHTLGDTVRGVSNFISTDSTAESQSVPSGITGVTPTGYTLGTWGQVNQSGRNFVGWQFRRAEKFFDIVQYTGDGVAGRTIAHSLGVKPGMIIVKRTDATSDWQVYQQAQGASQYLVLNSDAGVASDIGRWNNAEPNSSSFTLGNNATVNSSGSTYIAYLFAHDPASGGLIQCGSYVGNGSATGPAVNLGWRPQYLLIKGTSASRDWAIIDAARGTGVYLLANSSTGDIPGAFVSLGTTGFQVVSSSSVVNTISQTYIYMAIREAV